MNAPAPGSAKKDVIGGCRWIVATATVPGAIAIIQLFGDVVPVLQELTGIGSWPIGRLAPVDLSSFLFLMVTVPCWWRCRR